MTERLWAWATRTGQSVHGFDPRGLHWSHVATSPTLFESFSQNGPGFARVGFSVDSSVAEQALFMAPGPWFDSTSTDHRISAVIVDNAKAKAALSVMGMADSGVSAASELFRRAVGVVENSCAGSSPAHSPMKREILDGKALAEAMKVLFGGQNVKDTVKK